MSNEYVRLYWNVVVAKEKEINQKVKAKIRKKLGRTLESSDLEDLISSVVLNLGEKVTYSGKTYNNEAHVINSLARSCWQTYRDASKKAVNDVAKFNIYKDTVIASGNAYETEDFDAEQHQKIQQKNLYNMVLEFLDTQCSFIEAGIYKSRAFNGYTYDQLAHHTGFTRSKCVSTVKRVQTRLQDHLKSKGYSIPKQKD